MRVVLRFLFLLAVMVVLLFAGAIAQKAGRIESLKLLSDNVGWAATNQKLFWTTDNGEHWKDITPKLTHKRQMVSSVFFLDETTGWVLLKCADDKNAMADDVCFEFALTTDSGKSWSIVQPKITDPGIDQSRIDDGDGIYSGKTYLDFSDAQHGWAILENAYNTNRSVGEMLRTVDGGKTWTQLPETSLPIAEPFVFANAKDGWIAGGPDVELYESHNSGNTWQPVQLANPPGVSSDLSPVYGLPVFMNNNTGYLSANYVSITSTGTPVALLKTDDGGKTWRPITVTPPVPSTYNWGPYPCALVDGELVTATLSAGRVNLMHGAPGRALSERLSAIPVHASILDQLSFVNSERGWVLTDYWILSTSDGGVTWTDVTPSPGETVPRLTRR
jgi:photosystem II stability/assembly factor-like uncharacterized protein